MVYKNILYITILIVLSGCTPTRMNFNSQRDYIDRIIDCTVGSASYKFASGTSLYVDLTGKQHDKFGFITKIDKKIMKDKSIDWTIYFNDEYEDGYYYLKKLNLNDETNNSGFMYGTMYYLSIYSPLNSTINSINLSGKAQCRYILGDSANITIEQFKKHELQSLQTTP